MDKQGGPSSFSSPSLCFCSQIIPSSTAPLNERMFLENRRVTCQNPSLHTSAWSAANSARLKVL